MKKIFAIIILAVAGSSAACAQHSFTAKFSDLANDTVKLYIYNKDGDKTELTEDLIAHDGVVTYDFKGTKARCAYITPDGSKGQYKIMLYLVPGEEGTLTGTTDDCIWSGTSFYTELAAFNKTVENLEEEYLASSIEKYIKAKPESNVSATLITQLPNAVQFVNTLSPKLRQGVFSDVIFGVIVRDARAKVQKKLAEGLSPGSIAPDFTLNDINGKPLSLNSFRGKYVIHDFLIIC